LLEWNFVRQTEDATLGHNDKFRVTAVAVFSDHLGRRAKLFRAGCAKIAKAARHKVMHANAIAARETLNIRTGFFYETGNFMTEREWQRFHW
jgi:hypothetical protein